MIILESKNLSYSSEGKKILSNINIKVDKGDFVTVTGNSGSGKSTFLKICADLISPNDGVILFNGIDYKEWNPYDLRKKIAYLFQTPTFFLDMVEENLYYPFLIRKVPRDNNRISQLLEKVNLPKDILKEGIGNLSGGEKQRIALIRSLIFLPEILLLDEITSALDYENTIIVEKLIKELSDEGITIIWVTHSKEQSKKYANKIFNFELGQAKEVEGER